MSSPVKDEALVRRYEALRSQTLGGARATGAFADSATLMRSGLSAWLSVSRSSVPVAPARAATRPELPPEKSQLAELLAGIVLACGREVTT